MIWRIDLGGVIEMAERIVELDDAAAVVMIVADDGEDSWCV